MLLGVSSILLGINNLTADERVLYYVEYFCPSTEKFDTDMPCKGFLEKIDIMARALHDSGLFLCGLGLFFWFYGLTAIIYRVVGRKNKLLRSFLCMPLRVILHKTLYVACAGELGVSF